MRLNESILKSLNESVGGFNESSDPVKVLEAIYAQYEEMDMTDAFFQDILNKSNLSIKDLVEWYNMGEEE